MQKYGQMAIEALHPYERNARTHSEAQVEKIANSIREFGFLNPVLIDKNDMIIAGHGRVLAAQKLGLKKVPCLRVEDLTETQIRAYIRGRDHQAMGRAHRQEGGETRWQQVRRNPQHKRNA